jgi:hypothetical protein
MFNQKISLVFIVACFTLFSLFSCDEKEKTEVQTTRIVLPKPPPLQEPEDKSKEVSVEEVETKSVTTKQVVEVTAADQGSPPVGKDGTLSHDNADKQVQLVIAIAKGSQWTYSLSPNQFRRFVNEGVILLLHAKNALNSNYELSRFVFKDGKWHQHPTFTEDDIQEYSLNCRVFTEAFGILYESLPDLKPTDRYLLAFPEEFIAKVADISAVHEAYSVNLTVDDDNALVGDCVADGTTVFGPTKVGD